MRKLVYVGKDSTDTIVKTTSYNEMVEWKEKGFRFTEEMEEIRVEKKPDIERVKKVRKALERKRG